MNLNAATSRKVLLLSATTLVVIGAVLLFTDVLTHPEDITRAMTNFIFNLGVAGGLLSARFITKNNYTRTLMRLHGWNGGGYAVWVRVYADGRIIPDQDTSVVQCPDDLPAIHWDPCKGKEKTHVIVRRQVYQV